MWEWLYRPAKPYTWRFVGRVILKALLLFAGFNILFILIDPLALVGRISLYNGLIPGRLRLPYGENPAQSYNLSVQRLPVLFGAHELAGREKQADEYRVLLIGDSAVWGVLLENDQTLAAYLNATGIRAADGRQVRAYNLGYPVQSLAKDLLILDYAMRYAPDLVVWLLTPESFAPDQQTATRLVQENPGPMQALIGAYALRLDPADPAFIVPDTWSRTLFGQRRALADWLRLQVYGLNWAMTGHDQTYPRAYAPRMEDFDTAITWHGFTPETLDATHMPERLAFDMLAAGMARAGPVPVLLVNEPMFISAGEHSDLRYNFFYPRWFADRFRKVMQAQAARALWPYLDLWNWVAPGEFTDSAVHLTPIGSRALAERLAPAIREMSSLQLQARIARPGLP